MPVHQRRVYRPEQVALSALKRQRGRPSFSPKAACSLHCRIRRFTAKPQNLIEEAWECWGRPEFVHAGSARTVEKRASDDIIDVIASRQ